MSSAAGGPPPSQPPPPPHPASVPPPNAYPSYPSYPNAMPPQGYMMPPGMMPGAAPTPPPPAGMYGHPPPGQMYAGYGQPPPGPMVPPQSASPPVAVAGATEDHQRVCFHSFCRYENGWLTSVVGIGPRFAYDPGRSQPTAGERAGNGRDFGSCFPSHLYSLYSWNVLLPQRRAVGA